MTGVAPMPEASVTVTTRSLRRLRLSANAGRFAIGLVAAVGVLATARFTIAPPRPRIERAAVAPRPDRAAEAYATLFARRYLTWDASRPDLHQRGLAPFLGGALDPDAGLRPPPAGAQRVRWTDLVQERAGDTGDRVYTIAAQTDTAGLLYVAVDVARTADGRLTLNGYPSFVGAPASAPAVATPDARLPDVTDTTLASVVDRALGNYLAGSRANLAADLTNAAQVAPPGLALTLQRVAELKWAPGGGAVRATVTAVDPRGANYTLTYELDVQRVDTRWEIAAIQTDPTT